MESNNQYAQRQVRQFKADSVAQLVALGLDGSRLVVSRVQRDMPDHGFATPTKTDAVFSVLVQLRQQDRRELFLDDRLVHQGMFPRQTVSVVDHSQSPKANLLSAFDTVIFTVPKFALDAVAAEHGRPPIEALRCEPEGRLDNAIWSLTQSLLPALDRPEEGTMLYVERVLLACTTYFTHTFGGLSPRETPQYRFSAKQVARARDVMYGDLQNDVSLSSLASELDMPPGEFVRSFRRSCGTTPDVCLRDGRIEQAKALLRGKPITNRKIAALCGFASAEHFVREFVAQIGVTPATWRTNVLN